MGFSAYTVQSTSSSKQAQQTLNGGRKDVECIFVVLLIKQFTSGLFQVYYAVNKRVYLKSDRYEVTSEKKKNKKQ